MDNNENKMSFVLPLTLKEQSSGMNKWRCDVNNQITKRTGLMLRSFIKMFNQDQIMDFFIVCPSHEIEIINELLSTITSNPSYKVISEVEICPEINEMRGRTGKVEGWFVQQIIKLAIHERITTPYYLTFDSDILCMKPFEYADLFKSGKALLNIENKDDYARIYASDFVDREINNKASRFAGSGKILGYQRSQSYKDTFYGETPVILHTATVSSLTKYIADRFSAPWRYLLAINLIWTEYTLYFLYLEMNGTINDIYYKTSCNNVLDLEKSVWLPSKLYKEKRRYNKDHFVGRKYSDGGLFVAIQSWLDIKSWLPDEFESIDEFYDDIEKWLME